MKEQCTEQDTGAEVPEIEADKNVPEFTGRKPLLTYPKGERPHERGLPKQWR